MDKPCCEQAVPSVPLPRRRNTWERAVLEVVPVGAAELVPWGAECEAAGGLLEKLGELWGPPSLCSEVPLHSRTLCGYCQSQRAPHPVQRDWGHLFAKVPAGILGTEETVCHASVLRKQAKNWSRKISIACYKCSDGCTVPEPATARNKSDLTVLQNSRPVSLILIPQEAPAASGLAEYSLEGHRNPKYQG